MENKNREFYCQLSMQIWKVDKQAALNNLSYALSLPYAIGSSWTNEQIYSNMGMALSSLKRYHEAYEYIQKAVNGGLVNQTIIKELNWLDNHFKEESGYSFERTQVAFSSSNHKRFEHGIEVSHDFVPRIINIEFWNEKKKIAISVYPTLSTKQATLITTNANGSYFNSYMGDDPDFMFHINRNSSQSIEKILVERRDRDLILEYSK